MINMILINRDIKEKIFAINDIYNQLFRKNGLKGSEIMRFVEEYCEFCFPLFLFIHFELITIVQRKALYESS